MRLRVRSLALSCGVSCGSGSDLVWLRLWARPAAIAPIRPLAWELPYAMGTALKYKKLQQQKTSCIPFKYVHKVKQYFYFTFFFNLFCFLGLHPQHMEVPRLGVESEL